MWSPDLLAAARRGDFMAAGRALRAGRADPDSADERGWSALCFGAAAGDESMAPRLLAGRVFFFVLPFSFLTGSQSEEW